VDEGRGTADEDEVDDDEEDAIAAENDDDEATADLPPVAAAAAAGLLASLEPATEDDEDDEAEAEGFAGMEEDAADADAEADDAEADEAVALPLLLPYAAAVAGLTFLGGGGFEEAAAFLSSYCASSRATERSFASRAF
jgi:hypothetical protein